MVASNSDRYNVVINSIHNSHTISLDFETYDPEKKPRPAKAFDFDLKEFYSVENLVTPKGKIPYEATPIGVSVGWYNADGTTDGYYWTLSCGQNHGFNLVSWEWFWQTVLSPIWNNPQKTIVCHHAKFDLQISIRQQSGKDPLPMEELPKYLPKCKIEDTMILCFLVDENLEKSLKACSKNFLKKVRKTYSEVTRTMRAKIKSALPDSRALARQLYQRYLLANRNPKIQCEQDSVASVISLLRGSSQELALTSFEMEIFSKVTTEYVSYLEKTPTKKKKNGQSKMTQKFFVDVVQPIVYQKLLKERTYEADKMFHDYGKEDSTDPLLLLPIFKRILSKTPNVLEWYYKHEIPYMFTLMEAEIGGVRIDVDKLREIRDNLISVLHVKRDFVFAYAKKLGMPDNFNPSSNQQMKELLWEKMALVPPVWAKHTKSGHLPSDREMLEWLAEQQTPHVDFFRTLLEYSRVTKLLSTYVVPILSDALAHPARLVRTAFSIKKTGRGASSGGKNFQNIPRPDTMPSITWKDSHLDGWVVVKQIDENSYLLQMESLRSVFLPPEGMSFVIIDYSQIELRMVAHLAMEKTMIESYCRWDCICGATGYSNIAMHSCPKCGAPEGERDLTKPHQPVIKGFVHGLDNHSLTSTKVDLANKLAKTVDGKKFVLSPKEARSKAKPMNFGLVYLMSAYTLAKDLKISMEEAEDVHRGYFLTYYGLPPYFDWLEKTLLDTGIFPMLYNNRYRRFFEDRAIIKSYLASHSQWEQKKGIKHLNKTKKVIANNLPQGNAADTIKLAMNKAVIEKRAVPELAHGYFCLQVHDEAVYCVKTHLAEQIAERWKHIFEHVAVLRVPIVANCVIAHNNWGEGK